MKSFLSAGVGLLGLIAGASANADAKPSNIISEKYGLVKDPIEITALRSAYPIWPSAEYAFSGAYERQRLIDQTLRCFAAEETRRVVESSFAPAENVGRPYRSPAGSVIYYDERKWVHHCYDGWLKR